MADKRLATFVQISDLHFGDLDPKSGSSSLDADAEGWWKRHPLFDGYLGHSHDALVHLADIFSQLERDEDASLIVTGDVTAVGKDSQFDLARQYLQGKIVLNAANPVGLNLRDAFARAIPGNHDHWPGSRHFWGPSTAGFTAMFPPLPIRVQRLPLGPGRSIVFTCIDSDADVKSSSPSRVWARGRFRSQLKEARIALGQPRPDEIRVLLIHHSRAYQSHRWMRSMEIVPGSKADLELFIHEREIAVLLTGHLHGKPMAYVESVPYQGVTWNLLEARCGTTLQRDKPPSSWASLKTQYSNRFEPNTLLVHRLYETDSGTVEWRTNSYLRNDLRGFKDQGLLITPVIVWPRP